MAVRIGQNIKTLLLMLEKAERQNEIKFERDQFRPA